MKSRPYALGTTAHAARRLEIQDLLVDEISERLLDLLEIRLDDQVVELGTGAGSFAMRVLRRLGPRGSLLGLDFSREMLDQAADRLRATQGPRVDLVLADIQEAASRVETATVVVGRTVLHHLTFPEVLLGELRNAMRPATRMGFIEPDFRIALGRLVAIEQKGHAELAPLRRWVEGISRYYQARDLAPGIGATLAPTLRVAGFEAVHAEWWECPTDSVALENMRLFYDEVRDAYVSLGIMNSHEIERDQELLMNLHMDNLPAVWGMHCVSCRT